MRALVGNTKEVNIAESLFVPSNKLGRVAVVRNIRSCASKRDGRLGKPQTNKYVVIWSVSRGSEKSA